jgi:hypothetical protein
LELSRVMYRRWMTLLHMFNVQTDQTFFDGGDDQCDCHRRDEGSHLIHGGRNGAARLKVITDIFGIFGVGYYNSNRPPALL